MDIFWNYTLEFSGFSSRLAGSVVVIMPASGASGRGSTPTPCFLITSFFSARSHSCN